VKGNLSRSLAEGEQILRFTINPGNCNIDKVELKPKVDTGIETLAAEDRQTDSYSLSGQKVGANYRGIVIKNGRKILKK
jgi:hypothetical protein